MREQLAYFARRALQSPREVTLTTLTEAARRSAHDIVARGRDVRRCTLTVSPDEPARLRTIVSAPEAGLLEPYGDRLETASGLYLQHRFDVLGSGWVQVHHEMRCRGFAGARYDMQESGARDSLIDRLSPPNRVAAARIWKLVDAGYEPIDWQVDLRSGYRWSEGTWFGDLRHGHAPGADIKVPWEVARLQHLPHLALTALWRGADSELAKACAAEFRNQVLDFIASNPPCFGVCWGNAMEAAIRIANILLAYDLFRSQGIGFDPAFEGCLLGTTRDHVDFIGSNLEWSVGHRSNHFLADLAGLIVACCYLGETARPTLISAAGHLLHEMARQFHPEGSNFEASTSYHRFSSELALYACSYLAAVQLWTSEPTPGAPPLRSRTGRPLPAPSVSAADESTARRALETMRCFTAAISKPSGRVPQIGDNDNGRFFKVAPAWTLTTVGVSKSHLRTLDGYEELPNETQVLMEDHLDHRHLIQAVGGLAAGDGESAGPGATFESELIRGMWRGSKALTRYAPARSHEMSEALAPSGPYSDVTWTVRPGAGVSPLNDELEHAAFPAFGLFVFRSPRVYLAVRCGPVDPDGRGSHAHNDQLSVELDIDERPWVADPGTFVYTADPATRNRYRSVTAHFAPSREDEELAPLNLGLFRLSDETNAVCTWFGEGRFIGRHYAYGRPTIRSIDIGSDRIVIRDRIPATEPLTTSIEIRDPDMFRTHLSGLTYSPGYGLLAR